MGTQFHPSEGLTVEQLGAIVHQADNDNGHIDVGKDVVADTAWASELFGAENAGRVILTEVRRDASGVLLSAYLTWGDGVFGFFKADVINPYTPAIDAWHATYLGSTAKKVTQTAVTRDPIGVVVNRPAITVE